MRLILFCTRSVEVLALCAMTVLLPFSPLTCTALSGRVRYVRQYRSTIVRSVRCIRALEQTKVISRNFQRILSRTANVQESMEGHCTHCGLCCVDKSCVFLEWSDQGESRCSIYNNWFWKLTSCGSYPIDAQSIAVYDCPSFKAIPIKVERTVNCRDAN